MSNVETHPDEVVCGDAPASGGVEVLTPREVPLGGPRAMTVRRTLPQRARTLVGAWCFVDHYGPDDTSASGGMNVPPHPHTGLATVSWLFTGEIEHRDSHGVHAMVRPGELNLMTAGRGIAHSEVSTPATTLLHGVQLWVAMPDAARDAPRDFDHYVPEPVELPGARVRVFLGSLAGASSPVRWVVPLLGAEIVLDAGAELTLDVDATFEHGLLVDHGRVALQGEPLAPAHLGVVDPGPSRLTLRAAEPSRVVLLGGPPFGEQIVMFWNFIGRSHTEIEAFRAEWEAGGERFGEVDGYVAEDGRRGATARLTAPALPNATIRPRGN